MSDWSLPQAVYEFLAFRVSEMTVLEFGSGKGSALLASMCKRLVSVEHNPDYVTLYPPDISNGVCIHVPIDLDTGWYSRAGVAAAIGMAGDVGAIVVDGPPGNIGRGGLLKHLDLVPDVPILFDDTHRGAERELAVSYFKLRKKPSISLHALSDGRGFSTIGWAW